MTIQSFLEPITPDAIRQSAQLTLPGAEDWMQGRTLYGGASALVAYLAAIRTFPDLPPLRAAQVGFVAPVGGKIALRAEIVRQGRNVTQVRSEITAGGELALTAFWLFGAGREANAKHSAPALEPAPPPPEEFETLDHDKAPAFIANNFEIRRAQDASFYKGGATSDPVVRRWVRLKRETGLDPVAEMVLLGDTLPPGAMRAMKRPGPLSSINWSFNLLDTKPSTRDGWWLAETASEYADEGFSSERLRLWNADGRQMLAGMQSAAIFG
ncbi:acyl-CoA thioesterase [Pseudopontixanthobacter vadosimaris]|uniref:acyl-CoA thioesterase n=1 Tax=Pseudopontixanthobacter vadosimaris TaxID=2726450 RepID=UPI0014727439|nr:thioesterase family protein [Pseudopontixanthobacter vadosimaris]